MEKSRKNSRNLVPLSSMAQELDPVRYFENLFRGSRLFDWPNEPWPSFQIEELDNSFEMSVDLPGFKRDEIHVLCSGNRLSISAERSEKESRRRHLHHSFFRSFTLPDGANMEMINANFEDGVLTITVSKGPEEKARTIEIGTGKGRSVR